MTLKNWIMIHWIINPGLMVNELSFGQRTPRLLLIDKISDNPLVEREFVPCPHYGKLNEGQYKCEFKNQILHQAVFLLFFTFVILVICSIPVQYKIDVVLK
jgi:hypothetical protein